MPSEALRDLAIERGIFIGRERELAEIRAHLDGDARLVTLWGPGGAGKTRMALAACRELETAGSRAVFCELGAVETVSDVVAAIARTIDLELDVSEGSDARLRLAHALAAQVSLLVLDNVESATAQVAAVVGELLAQRSLRIIATSRERLEVVGEHLVAIGGLSESDAIELFRTRAREVAPNFEVTPEGTQAIVELLETLDRLPLAIELAAHRADMFGVIELRDRIGRDFELLRSRKRDVADHHASLEATFAWSWRLLKEDEQRALATLSVFAPSFTRDAAVEVAGGLGVVQRLLDVALVHRVGNESPTRLRLSPATRAFASARLEEVGSDKAKALHASYYTALAREHPASSALEWDNMIIAARTLEEAGSDQASDLLLTLGRRARRVGPVDYAADLLRRAARAPGADGSAIALESALASSALGHWELAAGEVADVNMPDAESAQRASLLIARCRLELGDHSDAAARVTSALLDPSSGEVNGHALVIKAALALREGDVEAAAKDADAAANRLEEAGALEQTIDALFLSGAALSDLGRLEEVQATLERAAELAVRARVGRLIASAEMYAANVIAETGDPQAAAPRLEAVSAAFAKLGDVRMEAVSASYAAIARLETDELDNAVACIARALSNAASCAGRARSFILGCAVIVRAEANDLEGAMKLVPDLDSIAKTDPVTKALAELAAAAVSLARARVAPTAISKELESALRTLQAQAQTRHSEPRRVRQRLLASLAEIAVKHDLEALLETRIPWLVARDGSWFSAPEGERVELGNRIAMSRILAGLAEARQSTPGGGLSTEVLIELGWPNERPLAGSGRNRVWVALAGLRRLGLRSLIVKDELGYSLSTGDLVELA